MASMLGRRWQASVENRVAGRTHHLQIAVVTSRTGQAIYGVSRVCDCATRALTLKDCGAAFRAMQRQELHP
jgi:hypothetical protein